MTEKVKKTTTAKARKPVVKKEKVAKTANGSKPNHVMPSHDQIADLARTYWAERGYQDGFAEQDWLRAERELLQIAS